MRREAGGRRRGARAVRANILVLPLDRPQNQVLLGLKKRGFGVGKYAGFGGKVEAGETLAQAAVRELREECGLQAKEQNLWHVARLEFLFPARPPWDQTVHVFRLEFWLGEPGETEEMKPEWFDLGNLPFERMWADAPYWLPQVLLGIRCNLRVTFAADNQTVAKTEELD